MVDNPLRARENAPLLLHRAGWHCPQTFQANQNKQSTSSKENLKQTFGSLLSIGLCAGNFALKFSLGSQRQKHICLQDLTCLSQGRFMTGVVRRIAGEWLLSAPVQHWSSSKGCEQDMLIGHLTSEVQRKCAVQTNSNSFRAAKWTDEVVGVKWPNN